MARITAVLFGLLFSASVLAQYKGPAVEACRAYAMREMARDGNKPKDVVIERDQNLALERQARKLGSQSVTWVMTGNGAVVLDNAPSAELSFICLLANEKQPVFFEWLPRPNTSALAQCSRDEALRAKPRPCLQTLLEIAENDLMQVYALHFQDARERDHSAGNESGVTSFRKANDEWKQYRDAECARRRDRVPHGIAPDDYHLACVVELTRRRALDMR
jgi:uncharacterized protein YecT (DUF1311 family)